MHDNNVVLPHPDAPNRPYLQSIVKQSCRCCQYKAKHKKWLTEKIVDETQNRFYFIIIFIILRFVFASLSVDTSIRHFSRTSTKVR